MRSALDEFEQMLISAAAQLKPEPEDHKANRRRRAPRWRRLGGLTGVAWIAVGASALAAASGVSAFLLLDRGETPQTLANFECNVSHNSSAGVPAITGSPLTDCAAWWPNATAGRSSAPALSAWVATSRRHVALVALVQPSAWGRPAPEQLKRPGSRPAVVDWRPLPPTWTVNLGIVALNDQLDTITSGVSEMLTSCERPSRALALVRGLLAADRLRGWRVVLQADHGSVLPACRPMLANVDGGIKTVQLVQFAPPKSSSRHSTPVQRKLMAAGRRLDQTLASAQTSISSTLAHRCVSVSQAAADWTALARRDGLHQTTLAYYREVNAAHPPLSSLLLGAYTLVEQPATQNTGSCAHVLVMQYGGGSIVVYAARIAP